MHCLLDEGHFPSERKDLLLDGDQMGDLMGLNECIGNSCRCAFLIMNPVVFCWLPHVYIMKAEGAVFQDIKG